MTLTAVINPVVPLNLCIELTFVYVDHKDAMFDHIVDKVCDIIKQQP